MMTRWVWLIAFCRVLLAADTDYAVQGKLVGPGREPLAGALVTLDGQTSVTDEQGVFRFRLRPYGDALLAVTIFAPSDTSANVLDLRPTLSRSYRYERFDPSQVSLLEVQPIVARRLRLTGIDGRRLADQTLAMLLSGQSPSLAQGALTGDSATLVTTDHEGLLRLHLLYTGGLLLHSRAAGYGWVSGDDLAAAGDADEITVQMKAGGTVAGRVVGPDGRGLGGVCLVPRCMAQRSSVPLAIWNCLHLPETLLGRPAPGARLISALSADGDGRYRLNGLPPGSYVLDRQAPDGRTAVNTGIFEIEDEGQTVSAPDLKLTVPPDQRRVSGRVVTHDGQPVVSQRLIVCLALPRGEELPRQVRIDAEGRFALWPVPAGSCRLSAWLPGRENLVTASVTVPASGQVAGLVLRMSRA